MAILNLFDSEETPISYIYTWYVAVLPERANWVWPFKSVATKASFMHFPPWCSYHHDGSNPIPVRSLPGYPLARWQGMMHEPHAGGPKKSTWLCDLESLIRLVKGLGKLPTGKRILSYNNIDIWHLSILETNLNQYRYGHMTFKMPFVDHFNAVFP